MKKKLLALVLATAMTLSLASCGGSKTETPSTGSDNSSASSDNFSAEGATYKVGICQLVQHPALDAATQGFIDALNEALPGQVEFENKNASGEANNCGTIVNGFVSEGVDLIMANATAALTAAASATADIPILGTSITAYGVALDLDDFDGTVGGNISGTSDLADLSKQADALGVREQLFDHSCLLVQRGQVRGAGDVVADGAGPIADIQRGGVVGNGGAQHRDIGSSLGGGLQRRGSVGQDQVNAVGDKAVHNGSAVGGIAGGVLLIKFYIALAQLLDQSVLEALGRSVQRFVLNQLADADIVDLAVGGSSAVCGALGGFGGGSGVSGGCGGIRRSGRSAGGQAHGHGGCHHKGNCFFHVYSSK